MLSHQAQVARVRRNLISVCQSIEAILDDLLDSEHGCLDAPDWRQTNRDIEALMIRLTIPRDLAHNAALESEVPNV